MLLDRFFDIEPFRLVESPHPSFLIQKSVQVELIVGLKLISEGLMVFFDLVLHSVHELVDLLTVLPASEPLLDHCSSLSLHSTFVVHLLLCFGLRVRDTWHLAFSW